MSEGYLQRLHTRSNLARPSAASVMPSGVSTSPVALADQRLNDPVYAELYAMGSAGTADYSGEPPGIRDNATRDNATRDNATRDRANRYMLSEPVPRPIARFTMHSLAEHSFGVAARQVEIERSDDSRFQTVDRPQESRTEASARFVAPSVGEVFESDFVRPEEDTDLSDAPSDLVSEQTTDRQVVYPEPPPDFDAQAYRAKSPQRDSRQFTVEPTPVSDTGIAEAPTAPAHSDGRAGQETSDPHVSAHVSPRPVVNAVAFAPESRREQPMAEPQPAEPVEVTPPPPMTPPPMTPPARTEPAAQSNFKSDRAGDPVVIESVAASEAPGSAASQPRPMTAAGASIIGPLSRRSRAVTLFGMRRR